jgi:hypothetical protein
MLNAFPLILIAVALYNLIVLGSGLSGHADIQAVMNQNFAIPMMSGDKWTVTLGDCLLLLTLALLFVETIKAARSSTREIVNHALSMLTFAGALVEFIVLKGFATSTFFFITAMTMFDVVAGYTISIVSARRDIDVLPADHHYNH